MIVLGVLGFAGPAPAQDAEPALERYGQWIQKIGVDVGFTSGDGSHYVPVLPTWTIGLTDPLFGDAAWRGNLEVIFEGGFVVSTQPAKGYAYGLNILFGYNFLVWEDFVPFLRGGGGFADVDFDPDNLAGGFDFTIQAAVGADYWITERLALNAAYRYYHFHSPVRDTHGMLLGGRWLLD